MAYPELEIRIDCGREEDYSLQLRYSFASDHADHFSKRLPCNLCPEDSIAPPFYATLGSTIACRDRRQLAL